MSDSTLFQQVFVNLIDNAVKFSSAYYLARIKTSNILDDTNFVKDNKIGIEIEYADQGCTCKESFQVKALAWQLCSGMIVQSGQKVYRTKQLAFISSSSRSEK